MCIVNQLWTGTPPSCVDGKSKSPVDRWNSSTHRAGAVVRLLPDIDPTLVIQAILGILNTGISI